MYSKEEKILLLGSLFHDIGKFVQRCSSKYKTHQEIGKELTEEFKEYFLKIFENNENDFKRFQDIILKHHNSNETDNLITILRNADHLSASQRVELEDNEEPSEKWSHIYLSSLFSKIRINSNDNIGNLKYYKQEILTNENYHVMIPRFDSEQEAKEHNFKYKENTLTDFKDELKSVLSFYESDNDTDSLINILLVLFEKYFWCIPDFTGNDETDISLYNHIKDAAAIAHCIYRNNNQSDKINLIVGDIPGIQNYIFGVENHGAAKMLRGRSIFIQILSRNFATLFLKEFNLSETNLIMLAGGKFYILVPDTNFEETFNICVNKIQKYLADNFIFDLNFSAGFSSFGQNEMKNSDFQFGKIIEKAISKLNENKQKLHYNSFKYSDTDYSQLILNDYINSDDVITDNVKCYLTSKPILQGKGKIAKIRDEEKNVYIQAYQEYLVGEKVVKDNVIVDLENNILYINKITNLKDLKEVSEDNKLIINPNINEILSTITKKQNTRNLLRNSRFFTVANYATFEGNQIMDFEKLSKAEKGVEYLTLIKGDIDELGLIMSYGLERDIDENNPQVKDLNSISRITTLSHHLKYYFSFFINGFLDKIEKENNINSYTVYAGGDDIMLICHQKDSLILLKEFNDSFKDFACDNPEVHISYSITHFKHSTPIRLVADFAEENQELSKNTKNRNKYSNLNDLLNDVNSFKFNYRKNSTFIFNTVINNENLDDLIKHINNLFEWSKNDIISSGVLRNLLTLSEMMKEYNSDKIKNTSKLMWHPYLTYMINRNLKDGKGQYKKSLKDANADKFFESVLSLSQDSETQKLKDLLYPACCGAIYKLR